jgi:hypothetical protein
MKLYIVWVKMTGSIHYKLPLPQVLGRVAAIFPLGQRLPVHFPHVMHVMSFSLLRNAKFAFISEH